MDQKIIDEIRELRLQGVPIRKIASKMGSKYPRAIVSEAGKVRNICPSDVLKICEALSKDGKLPPSRALMFHDEVIRHCKRKRL